MKTVDLSPEEISTLESEISSSLEYRNKQLHKTITWIMVGSIIAALLLYINDENRILTKSIGAIFLGIFMSLNMLIFWKVARRSISKLERDLEQGKKVVGESEIMTRNIFNRDLKLSDGTKIYGAFVDSHWKKGDKVEYEVTPTNEYFFSCKKSSRET